MRLFILLLLFSGSVHAAAPRVVTSIVPLQEVTAAIMQGLGTPEVIIDASASAHHFALRPSHMQRLQQADLVIWIDRHFEAGFNRLPEIVPAQSASLELLPALAIGHDDGHIWYSPALLQQSVRLIADELARLDPVNRPVYAENARALSLALQDWRESTAEKLVGKNLQLLVDHRFLDYFALDFGLAEIVALHDHHDDHGGIQDLRRVEKYLADNPVRCLVSIEPALPRLAAALAKKYELKIMPVASATDRTAGAAAVLGRLDRLTDIIESCHAGAAG